MRERGEGIEMGRDRGGERWGEEEERGWKNGGEREWGIEGRKVREEIGGIERVRERERESGASGGEIPRNMTDFSNPSWRRLSFV